MKKRDCTIREVDTAKLICVFVIDVCKKLVLSQRGSYGPLESYILGSGCDLTQTGLYSKLAGSLLFQIYMYEVEKF